MRQPATHRPGAGCIRPRQPCHRPRPRCPARRSCPGVPSSRPVKSGRACVFPQPGSHRPAGRRGTGLRPCAGDRAPGHQAVELAPGHRRRGLDRGFRPGQRGRRGADSHRRRPGHSPLHVPRTVPGRRGRAGRHLRVGADALRAAHPSRGIRIRGPAHVDRADQDRGAKAAARQSMRGFHATSRRSS